MHLQRVLAGRKEELSTLSQDLYPPVWEPLFLARISCSCTVIAVGSLHVLLAEKKRKDLKRVNGRSNLLENRGVL